MKQCVTRLWAEGTKKVQELIIQFCPILQDDQNVLRTKKRKERKKHIWYGGKRHEVLLLRPKHRCTMLGLFYIQSHKHSQGQILTAEVAKYVPCYNKLF